MRLLLLLSALFASLAGFAPGARAAVSPASAVAEAVVATDVANVVAVSRSTARPRVTRSGPLAVSFVRKKEPARLVPLYAERLRV